MDSNKRNFIKNLAWTTPAVVSLSLPIHAQASMCTTADLTGSWTFTVGDQIFADPIVFLSDGTIESGGTWQVNGYDFSASIDVLNRSFSGTANSACNTIRGTAGNETFSAARI